MRKNKTRALVALSALAALSLGSCKKSDPEPQNPASAATNHHLKTLTYEAGIRSNQGYPTTGTTDVAYYRIYYNTGLGQQPVVNYSYFGGDLGTTVCGYTAGVNMEIYAYKSSGHYFINYNGSISVILVGGSSYFTPVIEEIEMDPSSGYVYALCRDGNDMQLWRIDLYGNANQMTIGGSGTIFHSPAINGYQSGSLAFVPDGSGGYYLVFSSESTVYASSGIVCWYYTISSTANTFSSVSSMNKNYTGLPSGTAHINTTYGDGKLYFARDAGAVYSLSLTTNNTITNEGFTVTNANDFGYWMNQ